MGDFNRIRDKERSDAKKLFEETQKGMDLVSQIAQQTKDEKDTILFDDNMSDEENSDIGSDEERERRERIREKEKMFDTEFKPAKSAANDKLKKIDEEQREKIKKAILQSTSIEEVERLNKMLQAGYIPE